MDRSRWTGVAGVVSGTVAVALLAAILVGCGSGDGEGDGAGNAGGDGARTVQPGAPGEETRELTEEEAAEAAEAPEHTGADTTFMQNMIVHHQQALEMTALVEERSERDDLPVMAERITVSQEDEIERIEEWLSERDEDVPDRTSDANGHDQHELMPGMATAAQLDELERARGTAFDRLFLDLMIAHHQGALTMVDELYAAGGGGLEPAADRFARDVVADQNIEIERMQELRASLG